MIRKVSVRAAVAAAALVGLLIAAGPAFAHTHGGRLLATYQPVTHFDPAERFAPTGVQSFVADSALEQYDASGNWVVVDAHPRLGDLPGPGTGVWRLNQTSCTPSSVLGGLDCYANAWDQRARSNVVYGRVIHQDGQIVLQYWYFYYDDVYSYLYPPNDALWQAHEGDWEVVNVVLSQHRRPLFVGYSQHCLGNQRAWAATPRWHGTHPVVYVAVGSHANYFDAGPHPLISTCVPPEVQSVLAAMHLPPPADYTSDGSVAGPPRSGGVVTHLAKIDDDGPSWTQFPGFWGEYQYFHAPAPIGTVLSGTSPTGPAFHAIWADPLGTLATWPTG